MSSALRMSQFGMDATGAVVTFKGLPLLNLCFGYKSRYICTIVMQHKFDNGWRYNLSPRVGNIMDLGNGDFMHEIYTQAGNTTDENIND